ncbi:hypothetical protein ACFWA9_10280 [Kitasatospora sp. NPDC059973]|uniref:hypothetical protein n=1 Tax=Kitasatospora sp. NPDC059973 TaxID=3347020 RepID=UPI0036928DD9
MSAQTAAADALVREVQQHMSGPLGGSSASNAALLSGQPPQPAPPPQPAGKSG